ncbi:hypothetical protein SESBI_45445 [Sesbania bispinosa]|nr:hypothetical protein SESBI_45445 [Sesbania bispinosa]
MGVQGQNNAAVDVSVVNVEGERQEGDGIIGNVSAGDEDENDSSDESLHNVHFDDSEEERDLGSDDGFKLPEVGVADAALNEELQKMKELTGLTEEDNVDESGPTHNVDEEGARATNAATNDVPATIEVPHATEAEFVQENISNMHQIDDDYSAEELESDCYDSALEDNDRPHYPNEATTNVQATNKEAAASTPPATNNGTTTNEDPAASTVAPVAVENQPRPRGRPRTRNVIASSSQNAVVSTASRFVATTKSGSTSKTTTTSTKKAAVPKSIASKFGPATKTATASSKNATASASNKHTSASKSEARKNGVITESHEFGFSINVTEYERKLQSLVNILKGQHVAPSQASQTQGVGTQGDDEGRAEEARSGSKGIEGGDEADMDVPDLDGN